MTRTGVSGGPGAGAPVSGVVVVDGANVVGSRPDGWWRDRAGAARRLADGLAALVASGGAAGLVPGGARVRLVLVLEGAARPGAPAGPVPGPPGSCGPPGPSGLEVCHAPGEGDDEVVAAVQRAAPDRVAVVTADRALRARVAALGAEVVGPGRLRDLLDSPTPPAVPALGSIDATHGVVGDDVGRDAVRDEETRMESGSHQNVTFPSNGGQAHGYLATPAGGASGPGVVVIQEWWGLTDHIADVADRLAAEGFVALAPDLYGGRTTHDGDEAARLMAELPVEQAAKDLSGAVDFLLGQERVTGDRVGAIGFCMGGGFVLQLAADAGEKVAAAVSFYGVFPSGTPDFSGLRAEVLGHFGEKDTFTTPDAALALEQEIREQAGTEVNFHFYDAGHAFFNDADHLGTYDADHARLAWTRTLEFLRSRLA